MKKKRISDATKAEAYIFGQMLRILQKYTRKNVLLNDRAYFFENWATYNLLAMQNGISDFDAEFISCKCCYQIWCCDKQHIWKSDLEESSHT